MGHRAALVTGATGGIGGSIAHALATDGYRLTVTGRNEQRLDELTEELGRSNGEVTAVAGDVRDDADIERVVGAHGAAYGRLDVLVNSAGGGIMAPLGDLETRHVDLQLDLNLRSAILLFKASLPLLRAAVASAGHANVVNVSSAAGLHGQSELSVYSAAKKGLIGFTEAANAEFGQEGIRSTVFCPGLVDTPLAAAYATAPDQMIRVDDLAEAIRWLVRLSPRCLIPEISFLRPDGNFGDRDDV